MDLVLDPTIARLRACEPLLWLNPAYDPEAFPASPPRAAIGEAEARLGRFAPWLAAAFPDTAPAGGLIESETRPIPAFAAARVPGLPAGQALLAKCDHALPVSGSIKARGGIHEVLKFAEEVALASGMLRPGDDYSVLAEERFAGLFSGYRVAVGSTGNLGLSIGVVAAALGLRAEVHMSREARRWKKDKLRALGVRVVEYDSDYSEAVRQGRKKAEGDRRCHFVDDENSLDLFLGYAVAGNRVASQLAALGIHPGEGCELVVYLPCGVGGGPGGVAFGLKSVFGPHVHVFFAEPTHSPSMLLGMHTGLDSGICVGDIGLDNVTEADGLAVGRPSGFVGRTMRSCLAGALTVEDETMFADLFGLRETEGLRIEPSAAAGLAGPRAVLGTAEGAAFAAARGLGRGGRVVHLAWLTGGGMVPEAEMEAFLERGRRAVAGRA